ncbi:hypothetical protein EMIHUDRAFT_102904 [Emiliania huxleyi CCMP1516]|uniref:Phosphoinositide phospholipase C n=2 Tax=Emiliania huxleyi TaxID=2903 RepID=A0A0D3IYH5_EMIH1|nr:hypothetical protein EMIHUDRAFT_102904 [Emiliania huxleyi CCMP1516]EOD16310.1 hypothetical protein EMIHUDRAFT_102904 [Emiliania huxleyi CCMP1516]|eukprot:XP_005768739.1 hypothetical protein EMIHUDRAFT_102904 [Emiliania huxleyi CCMP1516]
MAGCMNVSSSIDVVTVLLLSTFSNAPPEGGSCPAATRESSGKCWMDHRWHLVPTFAFLAASHFNARSARYGAFNQSLSHCDRKIRLCFADSMTHPYTAFEETLLRVPPRQFVQFAQSRDFITHYSGTAAATAISYKATSPTLADETLYPFFGRTIPSDKFVAESIVRLWRELSLKYAAVIYVTDEYGIAFNDAIVVAAESSEVDVRSFPFSARESRAEKTALTQAISSLKLWKPRETTPVQNILLIGYDNHAQLLYEAAVAQPHPLLSPDSPALVMLGDGFAAPDLDAIPPGKAREAANGAVSIRAVGATDDGNVHWSNFVEDWPSAEAEREHLNRYLPGEWKVDEDLFTNESFFNLSVSDQARNTAAFAYDAVSTLGLLACEVLPRGPLPANASFGKRMWEAMPSLRFEGLTGHVRFDNDRSRARSSSTFELLNFVLLEDGFTAIPRGTFGVRQDVEQVHNSLRYSFGSLGPVRDPPNKSEPSEKHVIIITAVATIGLIVFLALSALLNRKLRAASEKYGISLKKLLRLFVWRRLPRWYQKWYMKLFKLDPKQQLEKMQKLPSMDPSLVAALNTHAELRRLYARYASRDAAMTLDDWLRFCSVEQREVNLEAAHLAFARVAAGDKFRSSPENLSGRSSGLKSLFESSLKPGTAPSGAGIPGRRFMKMLPRTRGAGATSSTAMQSIANSPDRLSFEHFALLIVSAQNKAASPALLNKAHDISRPISEYWIAASHNTYLVGHQLTSDASAKMYSRQLIQGCRCLEIDIWNGKDGEPEVTHGYTLVNNVKLRKVLEQIKKFAFKTSELPVILSLDVNASPRQQEKAAAMIVSIFKSDLMLADEIGGTHALLRPSALARDANVKGKETLPAVRRDNAGLRRSLRIVLKGSAYKARGGRSDVPDSGRDLSDGDESRPSGGDSRLGSSDEQSSEARLSKTVLHQMPLQRIEAAHALTFDAFCSEAIESSAADLLTVTSASELKFTPAFSQEKEGAVNKRGSGCDVIMSSLRHRCRARTRRQGVMVTRTNMENPEQQRVSDEEWVEAMLARTARRLVRIYPRGTRTKSDNFDPLPYWSAGAQLCALNLQTNDLPTQLHHALFELNGGSGFVLKPAEMLGNAPRWPPPRVLLHVATLRPISLLNLPAVGTDRPDLIGPRAESHRHCSGLSIALGRSGSGSPHVTTETGKGDDAAATSNNLPSLSIELHTIGGFACLVRGKGGGCSSTHFEGELHCVAAEPQQTVLRVAVVDEADAEVAYETSTLGSASSLW